MLTHRLNIKKRATVEPRTHRTMKDTAHNHLKAYFENYVTCQGLFLCCEVQTTFYWYFYLRIVRNIPPIFSLS